MDFDLAYLAAQVPALMRGLVVTIEVSVISIVLSIVIGLAGAACRLMRVPVLAQAFAAYVEFIRNTPLLVQLFFIFYGLPAIGLKLSLFWSGVACLTLWAGAFQVENIRGGLAMVGKGLREAAEALGLRPWLYVRLVAVPIAIRVSLPAMLNTSISLLKNSAYLQAIGLAELRGRGPHRHGLPHHRDVHGPLRHLSRARPRSVLRGRSARGPNAAPVPRLSRQ
jgi:polar amino acid transport system permease protein